MKYSNTQIVINYNFKGIKPGQWVRLAEQPETRGQYLGRTSRGTEVIRWQNDKFAEVDAKANKPLRHFAKLYGAR